MSTSYLAVLGLLVLMAVVFALNLKRNRRVVAEQSMTSPEAGDTGVPPDKVTAPEPEECLRSSLKAAGLCCWDVNKASLEYKLGLCLGVSLSWPGSDAEKEIEAVKERTDETARKNGLVANCAGPVFAAGGVLVFYCGFETPLLIAAVEKARAQNKPVWMVCREDPELIAMQ